PPAPHRRDGTTWITPGGQPASANRSASANAASGLSEAGLSTTVHPAARAGAILRVPMAIGKFHGVISTDTPTGWSITKIRLSPAGERYISPRLRTASSENQRKNSAAYRISPIESDSALPFSAVI